MCCPSTNYANTLVPASLVVKRIPKVVLEGVYGLTIRVKGVEEGGDGKVSAEDLLTAYASKLEF